MKAGLQPGLSLSRTLNVDDSRAIAFMGDEARVYATPSMINDIEYACRDLLFEYCDPGEDSVGVHVDIAHLAATPLGEDVTLTVAINAIDGRRVSFEVEARDALDIIGRGSHSRFVLATERRIKALRDKRQRLEAVRSQ